MWQKQTPDAMPRWVADLRSRLGADGRHTVIVTGDDGARFVELDRSEIDAFLSGLRRRRLQLTWLISSLLSVIVLGALAYGVHTFVLKQQLSDQEQALKTARFALDIIAEAIPSSVTVPVVAEEGTREARIASVKEFLQRKDTVFRTYVEATGSVMRKQAGEMRVQLSRSGLDIGQLNALLAEASAGGGHSTPGTEDLFDYFVGEKVISSFEELQRLGNFIAALPSQRPLEASHATSTYGMRRHPITGRPDAHKGIDFVSRTNDRIVAAGDGIVKFAGRDGGYGNLVVLEHAYGVETAYAHMARIDVKVGDVVRAGELLGLVGNTGLSTGPHLHFEVRFQGRHLDPREVFKVAQNAYQP